MNSPLPDSSALEAGIIEDEAPSRLSRVQDNVRNLLRNSCIVSLASSPFTAGANQAGLENGHEEGQHNEALPTPPLHTATSTPTEEAHAPPSDYQDAVRQMAHQSALFNTRAVAALNHPDLNDPSLATHLRQQKAENRQRHAWKRSHRGRKRSAAIEVGSSQALLCVFTALLLAAVVATYIVLATTSTTVSSTFHILFVLGIILATIVFAHSMIRLLISNHNRPRLTHKSSSLNSSQQCRHRHRHHHHHRRRNVSRQRQTLPLVMVDTTAFVPRTPIPVHMPSDNSEVRPDSREARPTASVILERQRSRASWDRDADVVPNPPPAYGRWRGSVRANPDLLHWQPVPSPTVVDVASPALPSPTYEQVIAEKAGLEEVEGTRPPSYVTRDSPARRRVVEEVVAGTPHVATVETEIEPEMVEVRGIGFAV